MLTLSQIALVSKTTDMLKSFRIIFQRSCRPTSGWTTPGGASSMPRWSKSSLTCAAWMKSTPSNIALCPSSLSIACSSPRWCLRCLAVRCHSKARVACSSMNMPLAHKNTPPLTPKKLHNQRGWLWLSHLHLPIQLPTIGTSSTNSVASSFFYF